VPNSRPYLGGVVVKKYLFNNKGSVLALTIMVFAVLMIFGTFTLSFMKTENTQSLQHTYKAQAYYYARSGVETVEKALIDRLTSFGNNVVQQSTFVDSFNTAKEIDVPLEYLSNPVIVKNEMVNGKKVITISSSVTYNDVTQTVKKAVYSTSSMITSQGFLPGYSEFFIYLGDVAPQEKLNNGKSRSIPEMYITKISEAEKDNYKTQPFPTIDWDNITYGTHTFISGENVIPENIKAIYINGDLTLSNGMNFNGNFDLYVRGSINIDGNVQFNGRTNIYAKDIVSFGNNVNLKGSKSNAVNQLRIYAYKGMTNSSYLTTANSGKFRVQADLYVDSGSIDFGFPGDSQINGHIIYNGTESVNIKTNSGSYADKLITGSIYAPKGTVHLGIGTFQVALILGGQVIGNSINVYPQNQNQGNRFYENSTKDRITNNPIPIDISSGIDTNSIRYESFFLD
jgi:hypothetical protein